MKHTNTRRLTTMGALIAINIILSRFLSISAWNVKIGFSFVPIVVAAILYGGVAAGIVAALGDFIGAVLFPIGAYFPGFTLTALCTGLVMGLLLHKKQTLARIVATVAIDQLIFSLLINSLWISILYSSPYLPLLATRIVQCAVLVPVQIAVMWMLTKLQKRFGAVLLQ